MNFTKGQLTAMAKQICKVNDALHTAISYCEELNHDSDICNLLNNKEDYPEEYKLLVEKIEKISKRIDSADAKTYGSDLDDTTELLSIAYENIEY